MLIQVANTHLTRLDEVDAITLQQMFVELHALRVQAFRLMGHRWIGEGVCFV